MSRCMELWGTLFDSHLSGKVHKTSVVKKPLALSVGLRHCTGAEAASPTECDTECDGSRMCTARIIWRVMKYGTLSHDPSTRRENILQVIIFPTRADSDRDYVSGKKRKLRTDGFDT